MRRRNARLPRACSLNSTRTCPLPRRPAALPTTCFRLTKTAPTPQRPPPATFWPPRRTICLRLRRMTICLPAQNDNLLAPAQDDLLAPAQDDNLLAPAQNDLLTPAGGDLLAPAESGGDLLTTDHPAPSNADDLLTIDSGANETAEGKQKEEKAAAEQSAANEAHEDLFLESKYPSANTCATCHPRQYEQWSVSQHAYAQLSPVFNAMATTINMQTGSTNGDFCIRCHTPIGMNLGESVYGSNLDRTPASREGITCVACHRVSKAYGKISGRFALEEGSLFSPVYGPTGNQELKRVLSLPEEYRVSTSPDVPGRAIHTDIVPFFQLTEPGFCGTCHDVTLLNGFRLEEAFAEFKAMPAGKRGVSCQDCHMGREQGVESGYDFGPAAIVGDVPTRNRKLTNHFFAGPDYSDHPSRHLSAQRRGGEIQDARRMAAVRLRGRLGDGRVRELHAQGLQVPGCMEIGRRSLRCPGDHQGPVRAPGQGARGAPAGDAQRLQAQRYQCAAKRSEWAAVLARREQRHRRPCRADRVRCRTTHIPPGHRQGCAAAIRSTSPATAIRTAMCATSTRSMSTTASCRSTRTSSICSPSSSSDCCAAASANRSWRSTGRATFCRSCAPSRSPPRSTGALRARASTSKRSSRMRAGPRLYNVPGDVLRPGERYAISVKLIAQMVPVNLIAEIQEAGLDYGMSPAQVAREVVRGSMVLWTREATVEVK